MEKNTILRLPFISKLAYVFTNNFNTNISRVLDVEDTFGVFEDNEPILSQELDKFEVCKKRAKKYFQPIVAWSGGIDSTFLLALFKAIGKEVKVIHIKSDNIVVPEELDAYVRNNFTVLDKPFNSTVDDVSDFGLPIITGNLNDVLFYTPKDILVTEGNVEELLNEYFSEEEISKLKNAMAKYSLDSSNIIVVSRFVNTFLLSAYHRRTLPIKLYSFPNPQAVQVGNAATKKIEKLEYAKMSIDETTTSISTFFETPEFVALALAQDWKTIPDGEKTFEKEFIAEVFGSDFNISKNKNS